MSLNPVVVIPTYWSSRRSQVGTSDRFPFDTATPVDKPGHLSRCLKSLALVRGVTRVIVLVVAEGGVENQAAERVRKIAQEVPSLNVAVVAEPEVRHVHRYMEQLGMGGLAPCASLKTYGTVANMGILSASIFGHDTVVFLSEHAIIKDAGFLETALYGLGSKTPAGEVITAKVGYLASTDGDPHAKPHSESFMGSWEKASGYNKYIDAALEGPRLSQANTANIGCLVLHADVFGSVSFDPWIKRGEDVDYVLSCRMYNLKLWLDNQLKVICDTPSKPVTAYSFARDMSRWFYENRKIEFAKAQIDLMQVDPQSFEPYPGPFLTGKVSGQALSTCLMGALFSKEHGAFFKLAMSGRKEAAEYARENCGRYFEFQRQWPALVRGLWDCTPLATQLSGARRVRSSAADFTGRFSNITAE